MLRMDKRVEVAVWLIVFVAIVLIGRYVVSSPEPGAEDTKSVHIGYVSWAEGIAMTHLVKVILEDRLDYEVKLTLADPAPIFTSLAERNLDFFLDAWLPVTHGTHMDRYGDELNDLGINYRNARIGLVVPAHVDVDTIPALRRKGSIFGGRITGIDSGAGIMEATREAIESYDLDMRLVSSSGAAMTASLRDSIRSEQPIVVTGWKPHWMFARWDLEFLEDPKTVYGEEENIHTIARPGIASALPEVVSFLKAFELDDQQIGSLMDAMNESASEEAAARQWISDHEELVEGWLDTQSG